MPAPWILKVAFSLPVPASLDPTRQSRSEETINLPVGMTAFLFPGSRRVDLEVDLINRARDHRLRLLFSAPFTHAGISAGAAFDLIRREPAGKPLPESIEHVPVYPFRDILHMGEASQGMVIGAAGLHEMEPLSLREGKTTLAVTLLRAVGWLSREDLSFRKGGAGPPLPAEEAQSLGRAGFRFSMIPHGSSFPMEEAFKEAEASLNPVDLHPMDGPLATPDDTAPPPDRGTLPARYSFLELKGEGLRLSACKAAEAGLGTVVRINNIYEMEIRGTLHLPRGTTSVRWIRMDESDPGETLPLQPAGGRPRVDVEVKGKEICTLLISPGEEEPPARGGSIKKTAADQPEKL